MPTKRLPRAKAALTTKSYQMPSSVEVELIELGAQYIDKKGLVSFTSERRARLKEAFIDAVDTYWEQRDIKAGPTDASVRDNIREIRALIRKLIKKLNDLDFKTADGLMKFEAPIVSHCVKSDLGMMDRIRLAHEALWRTESAATKYLRGAPLDAAEASKVFWNSVLEWRDHPEPPRVTALMVLWDGIAAALDEDLKVWIRGNEPMGSLAPFGELFRREAGCMHVSSRTVGDDFHAAQKIWFAEREKDVA